MTLRKHTKRVAISQEDATLICKGLLKRQAELQELSAEHIYSNPIGNRVRQVYEEELKQTRALYARFCDIEASLHPMN